MNIIEKLGITPGPWTSKHRKNGHFDDEGEELYSTQVFAVAKQSETIADMKWCGVKTNTGYTSKRDEHAKLIAAAPEMLEALIEAIFEELETIKNIGGCDHSVNVCCCQEINLVEKHIKVIEKATGKTWEEIKALLEPEE